MVESHALRLGFTVGNIPVRIESSIVFSAYNAM